MRGNQKNKNYKIKWTPDFAYAIGLLTTDGNLSKDGRHIEFTSKDIQLIKIFKECMCLTNVKIGLKTSGFTQKRYPHIQFSNVKLCKWLSTIGLTPNKTKTMGSLKIPDRYFFDFLRGHFDGDGSCYSYLDKRWKNSFMFYITFLSASATHIEWIRESIKNFLGIKGYLGKSGRVWHLRYAKNESKILIKKIYYKKTLPCLGRKREKIKSILKTDRAKIRIISGGCCNW